MDGDGHLDILIETCWSCNAKLTWSPFRWTRCSSPRQILIQGKPTVWPIENVGTEAALDVDAVLLKDDVVISRYRLDDLEPIDQAEKHDSVLRGFDRLA